MPEQRRLLAPPPRSLSASTSGSLIGDAAIPPSPYRPCISTSDAARADDATNDEVAMTAEPTAPASCAVPPPKGVGRE
eukprot:72750-Chlamydomonas_euryale.AAC.8